MCEKVHAHGALAAIELTHNGPTASNLYSREVAIAPSHQPLKYGYPHQARAMTLRDIREYRRWHRDAALRAKRAGFDIIYVYAAHDLSLAMHFLQQRRNQRTDDYGGSLENRVRLLRELITDTRDAVGDRCAVALRFATEEFLGGDGVQQNEAKEVVALLADLPDLWDVNIAAWYMDSQTSRFAREGYQEAFTHWVKQLTNKPVVGVGRFTSPDTMVSQIRRGVLDMIGAARPSIADPFLPQKIEQGRADDIRECIGCNICVSGDMTITPIRCTQNPTMGEEWRKGWHPERIAPRKTLRRILVVGAGPAGLEAARALGSRGYEVHLAEAQRELGGRVTLESRLPGLGEWARVRDWRIGQINKLPNVAVYRENLLSARDVLDFGAHDVVLATGCQWRRDGFGRSNTQVIPGLDGAGVFTPDDILRGNLPRGRVVLFDDDGFYLGSVLVDALHAAGCEIIYVTPEDTVAAWTANTLEYRAIQTRLHTLGVQTIVSHNLTQWRDNTARISFTYGDRAQDIVGDALLMITARLPNDALYLELQELAAEWAGAGVESVTAIGDCLAPGLIAHAVYAGQRVAQELEATFTGEVHFRRRIGR
jgi:dimethylamine/trimethylamine dehydrogenase